jgi:serine/threonine protein kinase
MDKLRGVGHAEVPGYHILGVLREGSMSVILKARREETGDLVALKIHKASARRAIARLESKHRDFNEGEITRAFDHPNVIKCFEHVEAGGPDYLVLEYLEGMTLSTLTETDSRRLAGHRLSFLCQAASGLAHVHSRRFIHHDFCAKNLFVTSDNRIKVIDFGLATPLLDTQTYVGRFGTAEILAPEILRREPSDHRADIFAWGVVAYEVLSGRWPFDSPEHHQVLSKILNVRPIPVNRRVADVPEAVSNVVMRCLEKDPAKRLSSMSVVVSTCERHQNVRL